jgi:hypothetical protein
MCAHFLLIRKREKRTMKPKKKGQLEEQKKRLEIHHDKFLSSITGRLMVLGRRGGPLLECFG